MSGYQYGHYELKPLSADTFWCDGHSNHVYHCGHYWSNTYRPEYLCDMCYEYQQAPQNGECSECQSFVELTLQNFQDRDLLCNDCENIKYNNSLNETNSTMNLSKNQMRNLRRKRAKEKKANLNNPVINNFDSNRVGLSKNQKRNMRRKLAKERKKTSVNI